MHSLFPKLLSLFLDIASKCDKENKTNPKPYYVEVYRLNDKLFWCRFYFICQLDKNAIAKQRDTTRFIFSSNP